MKENNKGYYVLNFGLFCIYLSGMIYITSKFKQYNLKVLIIGMILVLLKTPELYKIKIKKDWLGFFYIVFAMFITVSAIIHQEVSMAVSGIGLLSLWFILNSCLSKISKNYINSIYKILIFIPLLFIIPSFAYFKILRFTGLFTNSNGMGCAGCFLATIAFSKFMYDFNENNNTFMDIVLIIFSLFIILISLSRTSIGVFALLVLASIFIIFKKNLKSKKTIRKIVVAILIIIPIGYYAYNNTGMKKIVYNIVEKFEKKEGDQLNGRGEKWNDIFERRTFWGNGEKYTSGGAHNTYLSLLDQYGYIPFIMWIFFSIFGLIEGYKIAIDNSKNYKLKYMPLFCFICFIFESLFESMMMKTIMILCVYCVSIIREHKKIIGKVEE